MKKRLIPAIIAIIMVFLVGCATTSTLRPSSLSEPAELKVVPPDPSLPKSLTDFWGQWEGINYRSWNWGYTVTMYVSIVFESIDAQKVTFYVYNDPGPWIRRDGIVFQDNIGHHIEYISVANGYKGFMSLTKDGALTIDLSPKISTSLRRVAP